MDVSDMITTERIDDMPMSDNWPGENDAAQMANLTRHFLPNGQSIDNTDVWEAGWPGPIVLTARSTTRPSESLVFKTTSTLLQAVSVLRAHYSEPSQNWTGVPVTASECALYFCIKNFHSEIQNGTLTEKSEEIASTRNPASWQIRQGQKSSDTTLPTAEEDALFEPDHWFNRTDLEILAPLQEILAQNITAANVSQPAVDSISAYVTSIFNDSTSSQYFAAFGCTGAARIAGAPEDPNGWNFAPPVMQVLWSASSLNTTFSNLATSISANMRGGSDDQLMATGQLGAYQTFIKVRWPWVILPCVCYCLGSVFLLLSIWQTQKTGVPIWKNSALAILTHGLDYLALRSMGQETLNSRIQRSAEGMVVTLGGELRLERADDVTVPWSSGHQIGKAISSYAHRSSASPRQEMESQATTELLHHHQA
jgi:hypothetical protein